MVPVGVFFCSKRGDQKKNKFSALVCLARCGKNPFACLARYAAPNECPITPNVALKTNKPCFNSVLLCVTFTSENSFDFENRFCVRRTHALEMNNCALLTNGAHPEVNTNCHQEPMRSSLYLLHWVCIPAQE